MVSSIVLLFIVLGSVWSSDTGLNYSNFSFGLYSSLARENDGSVVISPLSVHSVLSLVYLGADGQTAEEMSKVMLVDTDKRIVVNNYNRFLANHGEGSSTKIANKIFVSNSFEIEPEFTELARSGFDSAYERVNTSNGLSAAKAINTWVSDKTDGMVQDLVDSSMVQNAPIVLVNAVHLKAKWIGAFDRAQTRPETFWISPGNSKEMQFMYGRRFLRFGRYDGFRAFQLQYRDSDLFIMFVLPNQPIEEIERKVSSMGIEAIREGFRGDDCHVHIPKFKTEFSSDLVHVLQEIGIKQLFESSANLSKLANGPIFISRVVHKAVIELDEEGTVAAAASAGIAMFGGPRMIEEFRLNRPFLYYIYNSQNQIFFMGRFSG